MSEVIVITSGKGGVGKTTTTANVGTGLAQLNKKVVLIDTDIGLRNLDVVMGLENRIVYNLVDVVEGNCRVEQALIKDKKYPNLCLLPSAQTRDKSAVSPEQMQALIEDLRQDFDYILLDCPAGIEQGFKNAIAGADRALVVTTPEVSAVRDADRIIGLLQANQIIRRRAGSFMVSAEKSGIDPNRFLQRKESTLQLSQALIAPAHILAYRRVFQRFPFTAQRIGRRLPVQRDRLPIVSLRIQKAAHAVERIHVVPPILVRAALVLL